ASAAGVPVRESGGVGARVGALKRGRRAQSAAQARQPGVSGLPARERVREPGARPGIERGEQRGEVGLVARAGVLRLVEELDLGAQVAAPARVDEGERRGRPAYAGTAAEDPVGAV